MKERAPVTEVYYSTRGQLQPRKLPTSERHIMPVFKATEKRDSGNYLRPKLFEINPNFGSSKDF